MKSNKMYRKVLGLFFMVASLSAGAQEYAIDIEDYFPGANLMKTVLDGKNDLNLTETQLNLFTGWVKANKSNVAAKNKQIADLEKQSRLFSQKGAPNIDILKKVEEANTLRLEVAATKLSCRELIQENLSPKQWKQVAAVYRKNFPFKERTGMMEVIGHVNPVPNYMSAINAIGAELNLSTEQKEVTEDWSTKNHPLMMQMADEVMTLEKDIYNKSLKNTSKEQIYKNFQQINKIRSQIVETKTQCRNLVMETLSDGQWAALVLRIAD